MSRAREWRPPRFIRLPPPELTARAFELDRQFCKVTEAPPAARLWGGRVLGNVGMDLVADPPITLKPLAEASRADASRLSQTVLGTSLPLAVPGLFVWTVEWRGELLGIAPLWWPHTAEIPLLLEVAVTPSEDLDWRSMAICGRH